MNWETIAYIGIYALVCFLLVGIMLYGCAKNHIEEAGKSYEILDEEEPVELEEIVSDDRPVTNI
jgi:hypothetical protein